MRGADVVRVRMRNFGVVRGSLEKDMMMVVVRRMAWRFQQLECEQEEAIRHTDELSVPAGSRESGWWDVAGRVSVKSSLSSGSGSGAFPHIRFGDRAAPAVSRLASRI